MLGNFLRFGPHPCLSGGVAQHAKDLRFGALSRSCLEEVVFFRIPKETISDSNFMLGIGGPAWMMRPYSQVLHELAPARADAGETVRSVAGAFEISPFGLTKWKNLRRETRGISPDKVGGHKKPFLGVAHDSVHKGCVCCGGGCIATYHGTRTDTRTSGAKSDL
ncbi:hypothetical protein ABIC02_007723 [Bradyrhizobium sp. RT5a]